MKSELQNATVKAQFPVLEMSCAACAESVASALRQTNGVASASVNYASQSATVAYDPAQVDAAKMRNAVQEMGYDLVIDTAAPEEMQAQAEVKRYEVLHRKTVLSAMLSVPVVVLGMFFMDWQWSAIISMLMTAPVVFWLGGNFFRTAFQQAKHGRAGMDALVALSTGTAFLFSTFNTFYPQYWLERGLEAHVYFEAAAVIITFVLLGKLLEAKARAGTSSALKKLMGLQPDTVRIVTAAGEKTTPIADVLIGDVLLVRPGEQVPVDGVVTGGRSFVDESMISGEPLPVEKYEAAQVFAGTINQKGSFRFKAEKLGSDTLLGKIIKTVKAAQDSKAPVQRLVDKIAGIFVPVVMVLSAITFIVWMVFGGDAAFTHALLSAITVLVIACPCALGLATPTAIMVGIGKGAAHNILIKDAESLEIARKVNAVILDKTGTLTEGKPVVTDEYWPQDDQEKRALKAILAAIESASEHPLAAAVVSHLQEVPDRGGLPEMAFDSHTGKGASGSFEGKQYYVGNLTWMQELGIMLDEAFTEKATAWQKAAKTVIYFADEKQVRAVLAIADAIKPGSAAAVAQLVKNDIAVYMLTGDNEETAAAVAEAVNIKHFKAGLMPFEKADFVNKLQKEGKTVAMVGDGINDAEALAIANVSIAMGKGTDIAMDIAQMTIISGDLQLLPKAFKLSRYTIAGMRQNLFWAFIYNLIGIPIAAGILYPFTGFLLNPMLAGAAMALSSVSVVLNSLRLKYIKL